MNQILSICAVAVAILTAQPCLADGRPRVSIGHMELRGLKPGKGVSRDLLKYLSKRLADGGTVDVIRSGTRQDAATSPGATGGPEYLLGGRVTRLDDTCFITVQVVPIALGLVTQGTADTTGCDQASLERSLEKSAQTLRNGFLRPPEPRPLVKVGRPDVRGLEVGFEGRNALARHLTMALVARGVARAQPSPRLRQVLVQKAKREGRRPLGTPAPGITLQVGIIKAGLGCQLSTTPQGRADGPLPKQITRRADCDPASLAASLAAVAELLADKLE